MDNLTNMTPDDCHTMGRPGDSERVTSFYYGVTQMEVCNLEQGAQFAVVRSPNPFVHFESPLRPWKATLFEVSLYKFLPTKPAARSYKEVDKRVLETDEVAYFEAMQTAHDSGVTEWWRVGIFDIVQTVDGKQVA